jgi:hypothetical protein
MKLDEKIDLKEEYKKFFAKPIENEPETIVTYDDPYER